MCPAPQARTTFINLEFDTGIKGGTQLGDIAASLVGLDELLRDLGTLAAYPSSPEFRSIEIVAIELRSPLRIKLALVAISPPAVKAFQEICRDIIIHRERRRQSGDAGATRQAEIKAVLERWAPDGVHARITEREAQRLYSHIAALQDSAVPLKRVEVTEE